MNHYVIVTRQKHVGVNANSFTQAINMAAEHYGISESEIISITISN